MLCVNTGIASARERPAREPNIAAHLGGSVSRRRAATAALGVADGGPLGAPLPLASLHLASLPLWPLRAR